MSDRLPWPMRWVDRLLARHQRYIGEYHGTPEYYQRLLHYAEHRDEASRAWLAMALARYDYALASRLYLWYLVALFPIGLFLVAGFQLRGCAVVLLLLLAVPLIVRIDRVRRRRVTYERLAEGTPSIFTKLEVKPPPEGSYLFQSYWSRAELSRVELDHPIELWDAVAQAHEFWQWRMPVPHEDNGRVRFHTVNMDLGLVARDDAGNRTLAAGGVVYFSYDPWSDRIDTRDYQTRSSNP